ncbi:MAG TPA: phosphatase PAP2 family protein [Steroidobacteraceae bacterium]|jgi:membrane-associated phospholipid phosphatase|nr:phosphatase PAP2 family protein [Steroidobacteraceae bacterium]
MQSMRIMPVAVIDHIRAAGRGARRPALTRAALWLLLLLQAPACLAGGGPFGIDNEGSYDNAGIWKRNYQELLEYGLIVGEVGGALWEGGETRFGRTLWQSVDASAASGIVALAMKYTFSRVRPNASNNDPNLWFQGHGNQSFPSGEVTEVSSIITPLVLEYGPDHPAAYALELLPVYDGIARVKVQSHWQSDVLAGFALGTGTAWLIHRSPNSPFILRVMPHAVYVGLGKSW